MAGMQKERGQCVSLMKGKGNEEMNGLERKKWEHEGERGCMWDEGIVIYDLC